MQLTYPMMTSVRVAPSSIEGEGVLAARPFEGGESVLVLDTSREVTESNPLRMEQGESEDHLAFLGGGKVVLLPEPEGYLNHSCDPNAYLKTVAGEVRVIARKKISTGEEVTIDYLINTHGGSSWMCHCGADRCRGQLETSFFELPSDFQEEYLPLLERWFIREHARRVEQLKNRLVEDC